MPDLEEELGIGIENLSRVEAPRTTKTDLGDIKRKSNENLNIIKKNQDTTDEEVKRNSIVNLIGALDYYVRELILWGILAITHDKFEKGKKYEEFQISINFIKKFTEGESLESDSYKNEIMEQILKVLKSSKYTFQKWDRILEGLSLIFSEENYTKLNSLASGKEGVPAIFQKSSLDDLNKIRNNIVHHFDRSYGKNSIRNSCNRVIKEDIELIETLIDSIHKIAVDVEKVEANK